MSVQNFNLVDYGLTNALQSVFPGPIVANRAPTTADKAQIGRLWIQPKDSAGTAVNSAWILTSIINNSASWQLLEVGGGSGVFASLTVTPGPISLTGTTTINTSGAANTSIGTGTNTGIVAIGNSSGASAINMLVGTGNFSLDGAAGSTYTIGASTVGGTISIGGTAQTGNFDLAPSTAAETVTLANGNGAKTINIGNGISGNSIFIGNGANTSAQIMGIANGAAAANSTVSILSGVATAGVQTLNLAAGDSAKTVNIGTGIGVANNINIGGSGANVIAIGNGQAGGSIAFGGAMTTGTITLGNAGSGNVIVPPVPGTVASPSHAVTVQGNVGSFSATGFTTAAAAEEVFTVTNALITNSSPIIATCTNLGTNDASMYIHRIKQGVGSFDISVTNGGTQALNGDMLIQFWILA